MAQFIEVTLAEAYGGIKPNSKISINANLIVSLFDYTKGNGKTIIIMSDKTKFFINETRAEITKQVNKE